MARSLLALGSNLGDRPTILARACAEIAKLPGCQLLARSSWHATAPIGGATGQGEFLNGAILLESTLGTQQLADALHQVEAKLGRQRHVRWDARTIDIDLLLYGQEVIDSDVLTVPHPRMAFRKFVLEPAAEIAGSMLHPTTGWTVARLLDHLQSSPRYVVVTAVENSIADWLASQISQKTGCLVISDTGESSDLGKKMAETRVSPPDRGLEFSSRSSSSHRLPILARLLPCELEALAAAQLTKKDCLRPALVLAIDVAEPKKLRAEAASAGFLADREPPSTVPADWLDYPGLGPVARITVDDPDAVLQEAEAALRCIWPDIR